MTTSCLLIEANIIQKSSNISISASVFKFEKKIQINETIWYPFIFEKYIYYRIDTSDNKPEHEMTKRFEIQYDNLIKDNKYSLKLGIASHNFRLFNINNLNYGIGGQSLGCNNHKEFLNTTNIKYIDYHNNELNKFIDSRKYDINNLSGEKIYSPNIVCPYYGNGLHLFLFSNIDKNAYVELNRGLPILSGIIDGRYDGHYGHHKGMNSGLSVYDSNTSILYNYTNKQYFLYQRSNIGTGVRYIQYSTSSDLIKWSSFKLIKMNPPVDYFRTNIYYNNFFKIAGISNYIGILPCNKKINNSYSGLDEKETFQLYYSNDCENWNYIGTMNEHKYYVYWMVCGEPILHDNKYVFYMNNDVEKTLEIYTIEKNRFSYSIPIESDKIGTMYFKLIHINDSQIKLNFKTFEQGYIKIQLRNINNDIIDGYSFNEFNIINDNMNEMEYAISWASSNTNINEKDVYIEIEGKNYSIYSIMC